MVRVSQPYSSTLSTVAWKSLTFRLSEMGDRKTLYGLDAVAHACFLRARKAFRESEISVPKYVKEDTFFMMTPLTARLLVSSSLGGTVMNIVFSELMTSKSH